MILFSKQFAMALQIFICNQNQDLQVLGFDKTDLSKPRTRNAHNERGQSSALNLVNRALVVVRHNRIMRFSSMVPTNSQDKEQYKEHIQKHRFSTGNEAVNCVFEPSWVAAAF
jgi:hypothetical protein